MLEVALLTIDVGFPDANKFFALRTRLIPDGVV